MIVFGTQGGEVTARALEFAQYTQGYLPVSEQVKHFGNHLNMRSVMSKEIQQIQDSVIFFHHKEWFNL
jgi:hypothetical protein